jgi:hypothetical protein
LHSFGFFVPFVPWCGSFPEPLRRLVEPRLQALRGKSPLKRAAASAILEVARLPLTFSSSDGVD